MSIPGLQRQFIGLFRFPDCVGKGNAGGVNNGGVSTRETNRGRWQVENAMNAEKTGSAVAIVGYSYRMPGGIRSDADFWRLLEDREIVQEAGERTLRPGSPAHRRVLRTGASGEPVRRTDPRRRRAALRPCSLRHVPQRAAADGTPGTDAADLRMGGHRAGRMGFPRTAQQPHRGIHRLTGSGGGDLALSARRHRVLGDRHQPRDAREPDLVPLQPHGLVDGLLHGLLRGLERPARGDERAPVRRLRPGAGGHPSPFWAAVG